MDARITLFKNTGSTYTPAAIAFGSAVAPNLLGRTNVLGHLS
jgi:hypothetical protein